MSSLHHRGGKGSEKAMSSGRKGVDGKSKGEGRKMGKLECPIRRYFSVFSADLSPHVK